MGEKIIYKEIDPFWKDVSDKTTGNKSASVACYEADLAKAEARLLNAFQLVKNGVKIGYLKFDEFKLMLDKKRNHDGSLAS